MLNNAIEQYRIAQATTDREARAAAFESAMRLFQAAAAPAGGSADLYVNIGTAALQAERLGAAIFALRQALLIKPDHRRAQQNLAVARNLLPRWVPQAEQANTLDSLFFWHRGLSSSMRQLVAAACFLLAAIGIGWSVASGGSVGRNLAVLPAIAWLALTASTLIESQQNQAQEGVITIEEAAARAADSPNAPPRFRAPLPGGTEVRIVETRGSWTRIRLANDSLGWVNSSAVSRITR